ncbi:SA1362 family protein [Bacillus xiapuensis]|uniref:SA1362 family protein n=1 Tax=Bacillus xiapuensis TaxID=2014075 RepID=UPI000C249AAA|nr:SA1362 family protein [Bacillus xiapuensis]
MTTRTVIAYAFIGLAAIGLVSMVLSSPGALTRQLIILAVTAAAIYLLYRFVMRKQVSGNSEDKAFTKAARQSKKRLKNRHHSSSVPASSQKKKAVRRRSAAHLKVIDGKKGKKNSRASS